MTHTQIVTYQFARKCGVRAIWAIKTAKGQAEQASRINAFAPAWQAKGNARMK